jgi:lysozyme
LVAVHDGREKNFKWSTFSWSRGGCHVLALDAEPNGIGGTVTVSQTAEAAARLHMATGRAPLVYISRYGPDERGTGFPNGVLSRCPLWLPEYGPMPVCPPGWSKWTLWQHTDGLKGSAVVPVSGIGRCDRSWFAGTVAELTAWWKAPRS